MKVTGKLKTEEVIEVEVSDTHYSVKVKALESDMEDWGSVHGDADSMLRVLEEVEGGSGQ